MSNRDNFQWRPNDNSVTTNLRYSLEAEKWSKAFKSAQSNTQSANWGETFFVIGLVISLLANLVWFILICIIDLVKWFLEKREEAIEKKQDKIQGNFINEKRNTLVKQIKKDRLKLNLEKLNLPVININERDPLFKKAALHVVNTQKISIPILQFDLKINFDQACKIIDDLMSAGIISKFNSKKPRKVFISKKETLNLLFEIENENITKV